MESSSISHSLIITCWFQYRWKSFLVIFRQINLSLIWLESHIIIVEFYYKFHKNRWRKIRRCTAHQRKIRHIWLQFLHRVVFCTVPIRLNWYDNKCRQKYNLVRIRRRSWPPKKVHHKQAKRKIHFISIAINSSRKVGSGRVILQFFNVRQLRIVLRVIIIGERVFYRELLYEKR